MKDLVTKIEFFSNLDEKVVKRIADACIMRQYPKNETIVRQGEMGRGVYVISRGRVRVEREQTAKKVQVAELGPEQCFGEMSLLDSEPGSATVTANEDTECLLLTRDRFVKLMNKYPEIPIRTARVLAERLRVAHEKLTPASAATPPGAAVGKSAAVPATGTNGQPPSVPKPDADSSPAADGTKAKIQKSLINTFSALYTVKAMTRFSVAVLGCPVRGVAQGAVDAWTVGDVKVYIFPTGRPARLDIQAEHPATFSLHVFAPHNDEAVRFAPVAIQPGQNARLTIASGTIRLEQGGTSFTHS
ncbi:MAG: Crp/Fnr family transcriptional regulator [Bryobacteraceae bacterium]